MQTMVDLVCIQIQVSIFSLFFFFLVGIWCSCGGQKPSTEFERVSFVNGCVWRPSWPTVFHISNSHPLQLKLSPIITTPHCFLLLQPPLYGFHEYVVSRDLFSRLFGLLVTGFLPNLTKSSIFFLLLKSHCMG